MVLDDEPEVEPVDVEPDPVELMDPAVVPEPFDPLPDVVDELDDELVPEVSSSLSSAGAAQPTSAASKVA